MLDVLPFLYAEAEGWRFIEDFDEVYPVRAGLYCSASRNSRCHFVRRRPAYAHGLHVGESIEGAARDSARRDRPAWNEDSMCAATARDTSAMRDDQKISSDLCQHAFQSSVVMHA